MPPATTDAPPRSDNAELCVLDPALIDEAEGFNPRTSTDDERLREITESVRQVGVLQPVTVARADEGRYTLIVGHRRLRAARNAGLTSIPALAYDEIDDAARLQFAIIENLQREDINVIDEARAFQRAIGQGALTQKQLAQVIGKSPAHVSERLRLLKLPAECQTHIERGALPLAAAKPLMQLAKLKVPTASQIAAACANLVVSGEAELEDLLEQPDSLLSQLAGSDDPAVPFLHRVYAHAHNRSIPLEGRVPEDDLARVIERIAEVELRRLSLTDEDVDAARSFGCLIEIEHRFTPARFITDPMFLLDRIKLILDRAEQQRAANPPTTPQATHDEPKDAAERAQLQELRDKAAKREAREQAKQAQLDAIHANRELGLKLAKHLGSHKVDRTAMQLLARIVLAQNDDLVPGGLAYTHEEYHTLTRKLQKNGKTRTTFTTIDSNDARTQAEEWVLRPSTPEEILGRLLQLLIAGTFADTRALARAKRAHWVMPASRVNEPVIAKLAKKLLPEHFHATAERLLPKPTKPKAATTKAKPSTPTSKATKRPTKRPGKPPKRPAARRPRARKEAQDATR